MGPGLRIRCFGVDENPAVDFAAQLISKSFAEKLLKRGTHKRIDKRTIQAIIPVRTHEPRPEYGVKVQSVPELKPPRGPEMLLIHYPIRDDRTIYL